jgi:hypothetical protein
MAIPLRLTTVDLVNVSEEFAEDGEPTEESETDGEQVLFASSGSQAVRSRQPSVRLPSADTALNGLRSASSRAISHVANELQQRNGIGGPLRC